MTDLVPTARQELEKKLGSSLAARGSLRELVKKQTIGKACLMLDVSFSMADGIATGERAIDALRKIVADVRAKVTVPTAAFGLRAATDVRDGRVVKGEEVAMLEGDEVPEPQGGTPLAEAIAFARERGFKHLIVISDGAPNSPSDALEEAKKFGGKIDAIFVGDDGDAGAEFMAELAALTGGTGQLGDLAQLQLMSSTIRGLLGSGQAQIGGGPIQL